MEFIKLFENWKEHLNDDKIFLDNILRKYRTPFDDDAPITGDVLKGSLEMVGDGDIKEMGSYNEHFMYKEDFDNYFIVIHGRISKPYFKRGFTYEISFYKNEPAISQIGGGYGASGIITKNHPKYFQETLGYTHDIFSDETLISKVCNDLIPYLKDKYID